MSLMAFIDRRAFVFSKDMEPALLYGARLTKYAMDVRELREKFNGLCKVPLTAAGKFHELDVKGRLICSDSMIIQLGLVAAPATIAARILPFPIECASLNTDCHLETTCPDLISEELQLINAMLTDLGSTPWPAPPSPSPLPGRPGSTRSSPPTRTPSTRLLCCPPRPRCRGRGSSRGTVFGV
jgi:hypothetical protein